MHRSGTSALAGLTTLLGATPPATLLKPARDNPRGFWESREVMTVLESLFEASGHRWFNCFTFAADRLPAEVQAGIGQRLAAVLDTEFGDAAFFVLKDPRLCLSVDFWLPLLPATPRVLLMLRHPGEVVGSLEVRERFAPSVSAALWLHYMLEAEHRTRAMRRGFVAYDALLKDWRRALARASAAAGIVWPRAPAEVSAQEAELIDPGLRHHAVAAHAMPAVPAPLDRWIARSWTLLSDVAELGPDPEWLEELDQIRAEFGACRSFIGVGGSAGG
ncbi:MAG: hypothetical protein J0H67_23845 [Rhodospirillales bacterium]|nr:hypothetical protein [Rhodospirillales bacterium]